MSKTSCEIIRRQIEEAELGADYDLEILKHVRECRSCEEFEGEQSALRRLVGSLGTVQAPSDFDFKLRARLANQSTSPSPFRFRMSPPLMTLATLVLFAVAIATVLDLRRPTVHEPAVAQKAPITSPSASAPPESGPASQDKNDKSSQDKNLRQGESTVALGGSHDLKRPEKSPITPKQKRNLATADFSSTQASTLGVTNVVNRSTVFPIDVSTQTMKVSLDDGRGNARTISLPGVSFGSQRVVAGSQFAPRSIW